MAEKQEHLQRLYQRKIQRKIARAQERPIGPFLAKILVISGIMPFLFGIALMVLNVVLGILVIVFSLFFFVSAVLVRKHFGIPIRKTSKDDLDIEISHFSRELEAGIASLSSLVLKELSDMHKAKLTPTVKHVVVDFAEILKILKGRGVLLESVECPHCGAPLSLPKTGDSVQCSHCNRTVLAMDLFEKLKDILS